MRRLLSAGCLAAAASLTSPKALAQVNVRFGVDMDGDHKMSAMGSTSTAAVALGLSLAVEYPAAKTETYEVGGGVEYQIQRAVVGVPLDIRFGFIPIYAYGMYFLSSDTMKPYVVCRIGYNLLTGNDEYKAGVDLSGGIAFTVGGGVSISDRHRVELLYAINNGEAEDMGTTIDVKYSRLTLGYCVTF